MALYKTKNGKVIKLSQSEIKKTIKEHYGWTDIEYKRQYNKFRNSYLNYKEFSKGEVKSVSELLYKEVKAKQRYGTEYKQSREMQAIREFSSASTQSFLNRSEKSDIQRKSKYLSKVEDQFNSLIFGNTKALEIYEKLKDNPVQLEKALSDFANKLHLVVDQKTKEINGQAIPISDQTYGSDMEIDFDIDSYL